MNWKVFSVALINLAALVFPYNIVGCGPGVDPYDYYTSFFHNDVSNVKGYRPFYFTGMTFFYDENEPVKTEDLLAQEWSAFCGDQVSTKEAYDFVMKYPLKDMNNLYMHLEKGQPLAVAPAMKNNSMTKYFMNNKDLEGLGYIIFAKKAEVYTGGSFGDWQAIKRDSSRMYALTKNALQLHKVAKQDFYKLRYAYQMMRLAHYSGRYGDAINYYDAHVASNPINSILKQLSLSLKAGALLRVGDKKQAAYLFSKAFAMSPAKRVSNYLGFDWSVQQDLGKRPYLALCKTDEEKAWMTAMFAFNNPGSEVASLEQVYKLNPSSEVLEILAVREINKLEEQYLSTRLAKEKGGKSFYYYWVSEGYDSVYQAAEKQASSLPDLLHDIARNKKTPTPALFEIGAAYTSFMIKDYRKAKQYLESAKNMEQSEKLKDQWALTNLLVSINSTDKIDAAFEEQLLPSIQWLEMKALKNEEWKKSYRNLMNEILAQRYHAQGDRHKEVLALGAADWILNNTTKDKTTNDYIFTSGIAIDELRNKLGSADVERLFNLVDIKGTNRFEQYLINHNSVKGDIITEFAGTAYLREYNYDKALSWYQKVNDKKHLKITKNPFIDLVYDREHQLPSEKSFSTTKIAFAEEMKKLLSLAETDRANASKHLYKYALGLYNMTYYGHTWELVQYYRSGADGYYIPKDATPFQREYYGTFEAEKFFERAMNASTDNNFKAKALFMMAKCSQKQVQAPQYDDYPNNWDAFDAAEKKYFPLFKKNKYFPQLVKDYGTTAFYKTAFSRCSYLRDFVRKK
jgi:hypothetical protein